MTAPSKCGASQTASESDEISLDSTILRFSLDGTMLASCNRDDLQPNDNSVRLWNVGMGKELKKFEGHSDVLRCVKLHSTDAGQLVSGSDDQSVRLWDG